MTNDYNAMDKPELLNYINVASMIMKSNEHKIAELQKQIDLYEERIKLLGQYKHKSSNRSS